MGWASSLEALATVGAALAIAYRPLGDYMARVFASPKDWRAERAVYRLVGVNPAAEQTWRGYLRAVLAFSAVGLVLLYLMQRLQQFLPYSLGHGSVPSALAFNTAASFVGNTNWQAYSPEDTVGFTVQMAGLAVQMYVSAAVGIAVAMAMTRGIAARREGAMPGGIGNFWVDLVRACARILLPASVIAAVVFLAGGVVQSLTGFTHITTIAGAPQAIPGGPVAAFEAIKMIGTNGGGFFAANSAHPFENPSAWANLFQIFLLLMIPFALPRTFGAIVRDHRLGYAIAATMAVLFVLVFALLNGAELAGHGTAPQLAGAAMEGKEQRFGIDGSTLFGSATTGTSGGASNSTLGSFTALGSLALMLNMVLGEISPGGVGAGLYTILVVAVIAVFLTGLLLGRAPVLLGKRIGVREMKIASLFILVMPSLALAGMAISMTIPSIHDEIANRAMGRVGAHGLSEVMYAFISAAINNGSAFGGLDVNTPWLNVILAVIILAGRFVPITLALALAGSFAAQERASSGAAELPLHRPQFVGVLIGVTVIIALPMFLPYLLIGPVAEWLD
ncbi:MAG: potassium-transporting ATPase subunit KdpA [Frankiaceae bacterium]|jgi:K+-transporting ATPase ATPase A chain|nr:potassium-transporting ATPase subunit KdpA [Frankiaceae bacterium]